MAAERRVVVSAAVRTHGPGEGGAPPGTRAAGPDAPGADPPDPDPLHTGPPRTDAPDAPGAARCPGPAETRALIRTQLRTALGTGAAVVAVLAGLPLPALVPAVARARVHGVPLCWLVLVFCVHPVWIALAFRQLRRAERAERAVGGR
ncbi:hypothetical protein [Actinomadura chokoriensis]|uniref:hypothetical protein n=1 Tax=Actinomadura chokoriensis TaxID=454156 RepID=UPI0031F95474